MVNIIVDRDACTVLKWEISVGCTGHWSKGGVIVLELLERAVPGVPGSALC